MKCKLCGKDMRCIIKHGRDYFVGGEGEFSIYFCDDCKIGYTYPEMDDEKLNQYYPATFEAYVSKGGVKYFANFKVYVRYENNNARYAENTEKGV